MNCDLYSCHKQRHDRVLVLQLRVWEFLATRSGRSPPAVNYEGWNFNSDNYLFTTDTK